MATTTIRIKKCASGAEKNLKPSDAPPASARKHVPTMPTRSKNDKKEKRATEAAAVTAQHQKKTLPLKEQEFLSVAEVSYLLHVTRDAVYKLIYRGTLKAYRLSSRLTIIRRADIEAMIESRPYERKPRATTCLQAEGQEVTEFYTTSEILQKYGISESGLYKIAKCENFPKVFQRGKSYWSKKHIDAYFAKKAVDTSITEWYSVADIIEKFNMTTTAVYTFVSNFKISKKRIKKKVLYSKRHVDIAKGIAKPDTPQYYTVKEAMAKFHVTRDQLYHYAKTYNIPKVQEGKYVKLSKKELDELFAPPSIER